MFRDSVEVVAPTLGEAKRRALEELGVEDASAVEMEILEEAAPQLGTSERPPVRLRARRTDAGFGHVSRTMPESIPDAPAEEAAASATAAASVPHRRRRNRRGASAFRSWDQRVPSVFLGSDEEQKPQQSVLEQGIEPSRAKPRDEYAPTAEDNDAVVDVVHHLMKSLDVPYEVTFEHGDYQRVYFQLPTRRAGALIGRGGASIDALEHVLERMISHRVNRRVPVQVDVNDYRFRHHQDLRELARDLAERVRETGEEKHLEPMPPRDRRVVHLEVQSLGGFATYTVGEGSQRHVVIALPPEGDEA